MFLEDGILLQMACFYLSLFPSYIFVCLFVWGVGGSWRGSVLLYNLYVTVFVCVVCMSLYVCQCVVNFFNTYIIQHLCILSDNMYIQI